MRLIFTVLGFLAIIAYAVVGALLMNDWAVSAATGMPLDAATAEMREAGQPYSAVPGMLFAALGIIAALLWVVAALPRGTAKMRGTAAMQGTSEMSGASAMPGTAAMRGTAEMPRRRSIPGPAAAALWGGVVALGAPAYFLTSFFNLNSVGDTFFDWNAEAAFALEAPLYLASGIALLVVLAAAGWAGARALHRRGEARRG